MSLFTLHLDGTLSTEFFDSKTVYIYAFMMLLNILCCPCHFYSTADLREDFPKCARTHAF